MNQVAGRFLVQIEKHVDQQPGSEGGVLSGVDRILGVIVNPRSRRNKKHQDEITEILDKCDKTHFRIAEQPDDISGVLADFAARSVNVIAISGGDGTVSRVLTHLFAERPFETMPVIAILRGGTANMIAGDVGSRGSVPGALQRLRQWVESGAGQLEIQSRSVLRVQPGASEPVHYGMFFGAGAVIQGIEYTNENIHSRGMKSELSLGLGMLRSMWGIARRDPRFFQPVDIAIGSDEQPASSPQSITMLLVSSLERLFLGMHPYWGEKNGKSIHVTKVRSPAKRLLWNLPSLLRGKPSRHMTPEQGYLSYNVDTISLEFDGPFTLDGEILHAHIESGPVEISNAGELIFLRI